jgi:hypothetical protein
MLDGEIDDLADLVLVDPALHGRYQRDRQADGCEAIERAQLFRQDVRLAANDAIRFRIEAVELKVDRRPDLVEFGEKAIIVRDPLSVGIDHDDRDAATLRRSDEVDDVRMNRGLAARELNDFRRAFRPNKVVENRIDFFERETEARPRRGKAQRTIHIAAAVDLNDA